MAIPWQLDGIGYQDLGFRVKGLGFILKIGCGGFTVQGLGFRICCDIWQKKRWSCHRVASSASCFAICCYDLTAAGHLTSSPTNNKRVAFNLGIVWYPIESKTISSFWGVVFYIRDLILLGSPNKYILNPKPLNPKT